MSDDEARIDRGLVWRWLSEESYWARGRSRATMEAAIDGSVCLGLYAPDGRQVGFCRWVTDRATFAFLSDVFVDVAHRGDGAGTFLVEAAVAHAAVAGVRQRTLRTADAHGLYAKFGFRALTDTEAETWMVRLLDEP